MRRGAWAVTVTLVGALLVGCSDDGDSAEEWCSFVEEEVALATPDDPEDIEAQLEAMSAELEEMLAELAELAPDEIADDIEMLVESEGNTTGSEDPERLDEASDRVNDFIREECGLDVEL